MIPGWFVEYNAIMTGELAVYMLRKRYHPVRGLPSHYEGGAAIHVKNGKFLGVY